LLFSVIAKKLFAEDDEQNYKRADVKAEKSALENNHQHDNNPHYITA